MASFACLSGRRFAPPRNDARTRARDEAIRLCWPVRARLQSFAVHHPRKALAGSLRPSTNSHQVWHREGKRAGQTGRSAIEDRTVVTTLVASHAEQVPRLMPEWRAWRRAAAFLGHLVAPRIPLPDEDQP